QLRLGHGPSLPSADGAWRRCLKCRRATGSLTVMSLTRNGRAADRAPTRVPAAPVDAHEWMSFEDPAEQRTWVFDVTFLASPWTCIFGRGCQGVLTGPSAELVQGCCSYGAHF